MERLQGNPLAESAPPFADLCMHSPQDSVHHPCLHTATPQPRAARRPRRTTPKVRLRAGASTASVDAAGVKIFRGVRMRSWGKWVSEIRQPKKRSRIWLGSYSTPEAAAQAYDMALYYLRGPLAAVNFPALIPREDPPPDLSPGDVQKAAISAGMAADRRHFLGDNVSSNSPSFCNLESNLSPSKAPPIHRAQIQENSMDPLLQQDEHHHQMWDKESLQPRHSSSLRDIFDFNLNEAAAPESSEEGEVRNDFARQEISLGSSHVNGSLLSYADHGRPMFLCL